MKNVLSFNAYEEQVEKEYKGKVGKGKFFFPFVEENRFLIMYS